MSNTATNFVDLKSGAVPQRKEMAHLEEEELVILFQENMDVSGKDAKMSSEDLIDLGEVSPLSTA